MSRDDAEYMRFATSPEDDARRQRALGRFFLGCVFDAFDGGGRLVAMLGPMLLMTMAFTPAPAPGSPLMEAALGLWPFLLSLPWDLEGASDALDAVPSAATL